MSIRDREATRARIDDQEVEAVAQERDGRRTIQIGPFLFVPFGVWPDEIQIAAQEAFLVGCPFREPEILGLIPKIANAEMLEGDEVRGRELLVNDHRMNRFRPLAVGLTRGAAAGRASDAVWVARTTRAALNIS